MAVHSCFQNMPFVPAEECTEEARLLNKICTGEINCLGLGASVILRNQVFDDRLIGVLLHFSGLIRNTIERIFFSEVIKKKFHLL